MRLSVIIVNYNVKHYLWQCLDSVQRAAKGLDVETWVVDNASTDGSIDFLRSQFPDVHYVENTDNGLERTDLDRQTSVANGSKHIRHIV